MHSTRHGRVTVNDTSPEPYLREHIDAAAKMVPPELLTVNYVHPKASITSPHSSLG